MKKSAVYTKTGDKGMTSLVRGMRVPKFHIRLEAYGTIDELNSFVGFLACEIKDEDDLATLSFIQNQLFTVGSHLATETESKELKKASIISAENISRIENQIDLLDSNLPPQTQFILPGGSEGSARAHLCRTVCRRAERCIYQVQQEYPVEDNILMFVNRLSDYFFLLARKEGNRTKKEIYWQQNS